MKNKNRYIKIKLVSSKQEVDSTELEDIIWQLSTKIPSILKPNQKLIVGTKADGRLFTNLKVSQQNNQCLIKIPINILST